MSKLIDTWVLVDTENVFQALGETFILDSTVKEYKVTNPATYDASGQLNDFTNESFMSMIHVVVDEDRVVRFYNQKDEPIAPHLVQRFG